MATQNSRSTSQRLADLAREVDAMAGPISPGRPAFYALSRAVCALRAAQAEVSHYERDTAGLVRVGQWNEGEDAQTVFMEARRPRPPSPSADRA